MKIKKLTLHNQRSYKHQEFEFVDGLNVLSGEGEMGKSAVLKAMRFLTDNNQDGNIISFWILDDKGKIKKGESSYVELETFDGDIIRRERTRTENKYILNGEELKNFGTGVPEEVLSILNLDEVNVQSQFESHFLLSSNPSAIAMTFNKAVNLEIIGKAVKDVNKLVKDIRKEKKISGERVEELIKNLEEFSYLEQMEKDVEKLEKLISRKEEKVGTKHDLFAIGLNIDKLITEKQKVEKTTKHSSLLSELKEAYSILDTLSDKMDALVNTKGSILTKEVQLDEILERTKLADSVKLTYALVDKKEKLEDKYHSLNGHCERLIDATEALNKVIDIQYLKECQFLLDCYKTVDVVEREKADLERIVKAISSYERGLQETKKRIEENFDKIKGSNCPVCGSVIQEMKED